jgi:hypothetical protein
MTAVTKNRTFVKLHDKKRKVLKFRKFDEKRAITPR